MFDYGAVGDGTANDTLAIQSAIDSCASQGGGTVSLHDGTFLSGMITLSDDITLNISPTGTLKGSVEESEFPQVTSDPANGTGRKNCQRALVNINGASNVIIEGGGTIEGDGENPHWLDKAHHDESSRPMGIFVALSSHVVIRHLTVNNTAMWGIVLFESDYVHLDDIRVNNFDANFNSKKPKGRTRDGIDIIDSRDVLIENSVVSSEDDSICVKSGLPVGALRSGVRNLTVRNCHVLGSQVGNGLKLGTASQGSFQHILFDTITVTGVRQAAMAVESVDGAAISEVTYKNIQVSKTGSLAYVILAARGNSQVGSIDKIRFEGIDGRDFTSVRGSAISGTKITDTNGTKGWHTYYPTNLIFKNVTVMNPGGQKTRPAEPVEFPRYDAKGEGMYPDPNFWGILPAFGFFLRHLKHVKFESCKIETFQPDVRAVFQSIDVSGSGF